MKTTVVYSDYKLVDNMSLALLERVYGFETTAIHLKFIIIPDQYFTNGWVIT